MMCDGNIKAVSLTMRCLPPASEAQHAAQWSSRSSGRPEATPLHIGRRAELLSNVTHNIERAPHGILRAVRCIVEGTARKDFDEAQRSVSRSAIGDMQPDLFITVFITNKSLALVFISMATVANITRRTHGDLNTASRNHCFACLIVITLSA